ncbi:AMP-binding protein [Rhodococcus sp. D-6]|uniref:AMP-binding protein n=1 Tax=Rhodococcus sp. D-6 TaxID=1387842 RepID=A0AAU7UU27_9NOCA|nr:AMP-binding protein [Rhodococcus sp. HS-D2]
MYPGRYAAVAPDRPAVHEAATGRTLTYRELEGASVRFAHWLRAHDVGKGDHIAVVTVNDATAFELYWGAVRSGVYVTFVNTHLAPVEAAYLVDDCDAKVLVVSAPLADLAEAIVPLTPKVTHRVAFDENTVYLSPAPIYHAALLRYGVSTQALGGPGTLGLARICDENGNRLPTGEIGTVYFERDDFSFEYYTDPEKTASTRHPFEGNWYTTGDIGSLDEDDYLFLTGRDKFTIISGGVNIYLQEIENVLALHRSIADVAVVGVPDADRGERVEAFVQLVPGAEGSDEAEDDIIGFCRERLSRFKCPRHVRFVDELPRTPTGKMVEGRLGELIAQYADTGALS